MKKQWLIASLLLMVTSIYAQEDAETTETVVVENAEITEVTNSTETAVETDNTEVTGEADSVETTENNEGLVAPDTTVQNVGYIITNGDTLYASPMARFEVQGIDEQSGLRSILVSVDGGEYAPYKEPISFTTEGEHSLNYQFIDRVGNISFSKVFSINIDATVPRVIDLKLSPEPYKASGSFYVGPQTEFAFKSYDDITGVAYVEYSTNTEDMIRAENNQTFASLGYTNTSVLRLSYQATDMVSNVSPIKSTVLVVDATAPVVEVFAAKVAEIDEVRYISSKDTIYIYSYDEDTKISKVVYAINDINVFMEYNEQIGINIKEAGEYTVYAKAVDVVGNESDIVEYKVTVDVLPPTGDTTYIGSVRSSEYDATAVPMTEIEEPTEYETTEQNIEDTDTTSTSMDEMPADTVVDAMVTEEPQVQ